MNTANIKNTTNDVTILVTGAGGFIGSHMVEALLALGYKVNALVYYNPFNSWGWLDTIDIKQEQLKIFSGDVRDKNTVKLAMEGCTYVIHLAALIGIPYSYHAPQSYIDTNITGTYNVLQSAYELKVHKILHTSTSEVYGTAKYVPINEEHPLQGQSPYSASKIGADQIALSFYYSFACPVTIIRPFNTYGPRQSARAIIPTIITQIASGNKKLKLGSLDPTRDLSYVMDTVNGFIRALKTENTIAGETINLGSNFEITMREVVELIQKIMGVKVNVEIDPTRIRPEGSEVERLWSNNEKAKSLINWCPEYSQWEGLKKGLEITIDWFTKPENLKCYKMNIYNV